MKKLSSHPIADMFPLMDSDDLHQLAMDIEERGLRSPIVLHEGKILDGRNRYRACLMAGVEPDFVQYKGSDPIGFAVSLNLQRRHLNTSQRATIAARIANMKHGGDRKTDQELNLALDRKADQETNLSLETAADRLSVSVASVKNAKKLIDEAPKSLVKQVERGEKTINAALQEVREQQKEDPELIDKLGLPVPDGIAKEWLRADSVGRDLMRRLVELKSTLTHAHEEKDAIYNEINLTNCAAEIAHVYNSLKYVVPHAVCPTCQGHTIKQCTACGHRGFVSKHFWEVCIAEEIRAIRMQQIKNLKRKK